MTYRATTDEQTEQLAVLAEEMGEALQIVGKVLRHGYQSSNPNDPDRVSNRKLLAREVGDVLHAVCMMIEGGHFLSKEELILRQSEKSLSIEKYLHHARPARGRMVYQP